MSKDEILEQVECEGAAYYFSNYARPADIEEDWDEHLVYLYTSLIAAAARLNDLYDQLRLALT